MIPANLSPLANHLWQSTVFAGAAWLLTLSLRRNRASVRYALWLAASLKFLVPFSLLMNAGSSLGWQRPAPIAQAPVSVVLAQIGRPFAEIEPLVSAPAAAPASNPVTLILLAVWACGFAASAIVWLRLWTRLRAAFRAATPLRTDLPIPVMTSPARLEPGVFGIFKPVLLLPDGIADRLTPAQLESILAHELCHVRRRDNLAAAGHMLVESVFWFHPVVWWIGSRLVEERERACDEEVVQLGSEPQVYAEGILNVCKFYLQSRLACASGVTGADLRKRVEEIVSCRISHNLDFARKILLAAAGVAAVTGPVFIGFLHAPQSRAQSSEALTFEVASVKPADPNSNQVSLGFAPGGGLNAINVSVKQLIAMAYNVTCGKMCDERITGGPGWLDSSRYDVMARAPASDQNSTREQVRQRVQALLADRFKLVVRRETREAPVFELVVAKGGHKLKEYTGDGPGGIRGSRPGELIAERASLSGLVVNLTGMVGRPVIDRTGLNGRYDFKLEWTPEMLGGGKGPGGPGEKVDPSGPEFGGGSIFSALQEQLGLKLESKKGPVEYILIQSAEKPAAN
jgi:uncharacterized protein (TIGR03435 family)